MNRVPEKRLGQNTKRAREHNGIDYRPIFARQSVDEITAAGDNIEFVPRAVAAHRLHGRALWVALL
jgi:hypothetical protein